MSGFIENRSNPKKKIKYIYCKLSIKAEKKYGTQRLPKQDDMHKSSVLEIT